MPFDRLLGGGLLVALALVGPPSSRAQFEACEDTLTLRSPTDLDVTFERSPVTGNRLRWAAVAQPDAGCFRLEVPDQTRQRTSPRAGGSYRDIYDRSIKFQAAPGLVGIVGDPTQDQVRFDIDGQPAFVEVPSLSGFLNLSNRGGIFRTSLQSGTAVQINGPLDRAPSNDGRLPNHLRKTDVTALATWQSTDGLQTVIYAGITDIPVVRSDDNGQTWRETAAGAIDPIGRPVSALAVAPSNPERLFLGTENRGLWRSDDGGRTFQRADRNLTTSDTAVSLLTYLRVGDGGSGTRNRLFLGLRGVGLFYSDDDGDNWILVTQLLVPTSTGGVFCDRPTVPRAEPRAARVRCMAVSPHNANRVYAGLSDWGLYRSDDGGITWTKASNGMVLCPDEAGNATGRPVSIDAIVVLRQQTDGRDNLLVASSARGAFLSANAGDSWGNNPLPLENVEDSVQTRVSALLQDPSNDTLVYAVTPILGLLQNGSLGSGDWEPWSGAQPILTNQLSAVARVPGAGAQPGDLLIGTSGAGVYLAGTDIDLTRATVGTLPPDENSNNQPRLVDVDLGLTIRFEEGVVDSTDRFEVFGQRIQGYAVWRSDRRDFVTGEPLWQMVGLYDLTNPEFCFRDPCDAPNPTRIVGCFADKRANCFDFHDDGTVTFFDREVQNGFTYRYAVSTFDYGFGGNTAPTSFRGEMLFSPRTANETADQALPFTGARRLEADLSLSVAVANVNPGPGGQTSITFTITNLGVLGTGDVSVELDPPVGASYDLGGATLSAGQIVGDEWSLDFLSVGASETMTVPTTVGASGVAMVQAALVASAELDPDPNNDVARQTLSAEGVDLAIALSADVATQIVGKPVRLTVGVTNVGSTPATGVHLQMVQPAGLRFTSVEGAESYVEGLARLGSLAPGQTRTIDVTAIMLRAGEGPVSVALATVDQADTNPANDRARIEVVGSNYNALEFQVNVDAGDDLQQVFVVPNPLRGFAGFDRDGGSSVRFVNVTRDSRCEIYTIAGDRVRTLTNVVTSGEQRGNIQWDTKNEAGESVASGVYLYRITNETGDEIIGRFTIIR